MLPTCQISLVPCHTWLAREIFLLQEQTMCIPVKSLHKHEIVSVHFNIFSLI